MITLYHLDRSRSDRIVWALEELGLDYEIERFERDPETQRAPAALRAVHASGKAPILRDGDTLLIESGAIVEYLLARYGDGGLAPEITHESFPDYLQWLHFAEGSAMFPIVLGHLARAGLGGPPETSPLTAISRAEVDALCARLEEVLSERLYFAGEAFTAADIMMGFVVETLEAIEALEGHPSLVRYVERLRERPAHRRARVRAAVGLSPG